MPDTALTKTNQSVAGAYARLRDQVEWAINSLSVLERCDPSEAAELRGWLERLLDDARNAVEQFEIDVAARAAGHLQ